jgi:hypothetical protein
MILWWLLQITSYHLQMGVIRASPLVPKVTILYKIIFLYCIVNRTCFFIYLIKHVEWMFFNPCSRSQVVSNDDVHIDIAQFFINLSNLNVSFNIEMLLSLSMYSPTDFKVIFSKDVRPNLRFL